MASTETASLSDNEIITEFKILCSKNLNDASICFLNLVRRLEKLNGEIDSMSKESVLKDNRIKQQEKRIKSLTQLTEIYEKEEEEICSVNS